MPRSLLAFVGLFVAASLAESAEPVKIEAFRIEWCYMNFFHVRFQAPDNLLLPSIGSNDPTSMARLPRLVCDTTQAVHLILHNNLAFKPGALEFVGIWPNAQRDDSEIKCQLLYPVASKSEKKNGTDALENCEWVEKPVVLKWNDAKKGLSPAGVNRKKPISYAAIMELWGGAMKGHYAAMQKQSPDTGFYAFAQAVLTRGFELPADQLIADAGPNPNYRHIYEIVTGGSALADSLQIDRILKPQAGDAKPFIHISAVRGIDIPEHPWAKMMGNKKPDPEPLAELIPADNYYVRFRSLDQLNNFGELIDQWGNNLLHAFDYKTRDYGLRRRYERQLGLPPGNALNKFSSAKLKGIAITGSDPYLRDGSDVTVIFHAKDPTRLVTIQDQYIEQRVKELNESIAHRLPGHHNNHVESYLTSHRELSFHRIVLGEFVVCSNSLVGLQRIIDVHAKKDKALSESLDFQFMRTCFRADDKDEDGFAFLSDAFIRRLAGPALRIKQARRAQALAALQSATHAAILLKTYSGKLPEKTEDLIRFDLLVKNDLQIGDKEIIEWKENRAQSATYGTIHFATPLIELPIGTITKSEYDEYEQFRREYLSLWQRFFDPVGMRFHQRGNKTSVEAFILPLVLSQNYSLLRGLTEGGTAKFGLAKTNSRTMLHLMASLSLSGNFVFGNGTTRRGSVFLRVDDDKLIKEIMQLVIEDERTGRSPDVSAQLLRKLLQLPIVVGVEGEVVDSIKALLPLLKSSLAFEELREKYRGVTIEIRKAPKDHEFTRKCNSPDMKDLFQPSFYYAEIGKGLYFSLRKELIKELIDQHLDKTAGKSEGPEVNAAIRLNPRAAPDTREALYQYFEWQTHRKALMGNAAWYALHRSGLIPKGSSEAQEIAVARQYLGYVPISSDGVGYLYDPRFDEVVNRRHGSYRQPTLRPTLGANAPLRKILDQSRGIQLELRFREDGVHTKVTLEKGK